MMRFTAIPYSPWSEKARWALTHHRVEYREEPYLPVLGELGLRLRLRKLGGRVTVPVLQDGSRFYTDSFEIARHAERIGTGAPLMPDGKLAEITAWNERSEAALAAGRGLLMLRLSRDPDAIRAYISTILPAVLGPVMMPVARVSTRAFMRKYHIEEAADRHRGVLQQALTEFEAALAPGKDYLLGEFSYADITMALLPHLLRPVDARFMAGFPGMPGGREASVDPDLTQRFAALIEWRDRLYARHRHT